MIAAISDVSRKVMRNVSPMARQMSLSFSSLQSSPSAGIDVISGVVMGALVAIMVGSSREGMGDDEGAGDGEGEADDEGEGEVEAIGEGKGGGVIVTRVRRLFAGISNKATMLMPEICSLRVLSPSTSLLLKRVMGTPILSCPAGKEIGNLLSPLIVI